ncbi:glycosyltransferase family 58 protein [Conidiobolus coronatus NRRL 28638]|uniref:Dol-P-Man:Man(5)GlcNAc(2)-PP-Dol alpha-1,3-mannosyltransferase n=1 Tax=Conidiobolus coronatus (strain ATCC 28846 / CBS 209.66 / NRRL 28638) TaxID=796925 RepID=A0A137P6V5_CONC2|nr:glycosyltransferase family 58 protein [Conidiobolus coronatus NRRL 28638]|eukprot:KXN70743.1 glycosyltransferase family 58 protein [Conidiobolus coronatus NRRL 28638]
MKPIEIKPLKPASSEAKANEGKLTRFESLKLKYPVLTNPDTSILPYLLLAFELILNIAIVYKVPYTEIDWQAYMQQIELYLGGELNYLNLKGDTGPLVYPAGFVYIYSILYKLSNFGKNIKIGQYCFIGFYLIHQLLTFSIYKKLKLPPYLLIFLCLSKRQHSIFTLRLFNDPLAIIFVLLAIHQLFANSYTLATILYSIGISIKMNCLLFLPGYLFILFNDLGAYKLIGHIGLLAAAQIIIGFPFLNSYPSEYLSKAFEFTRQFDYEWTVNWKMLSPPTFLNSSFHKLLLMYHLVFLLGFLVTRWTEPINGGIIQFAINGFNAANQKLTNFEKFKVLSICNFIGIVFSRSLHFQFYSWYYFSIPFLLKETGLYPSISLLLWASIEYVWNTYPSTELTSVILFVAHNIILSGLFFNYYKGYKPQETRISDIKLKKQ